MRDYSKIGPRFWTGPTGKQIRASGRDAQVVAFYLMTCASANMIGLYYLALPTLSHETGIPLQGALKALRSLSEAQFARYDEASETVYVPEMARHQLGERVTSKDNRHKAILRELEFVSNSLFYKDFIARYRDVFELQTLAEPIISTSPIEGPCKPLRSQEQEQEQEKEQKQEQEGEREGESPAAVAASAATMNGKHPKPKSSRKCPEAFAITPQLRQLEVELPDDFDLEGETAKFRDHEFRVAHSDWPATWRKWMRTARDDKRYAKKRVQRWE